MSDGYEAGYIHGSAFARLSIAITAVADSLTYVKDDTALRDVLRTLSAERDGLARPDDV